MDKERAILAHSIVSNAGGKFYELGDYCEGHFSGLGCELAINVAVKKLKEKNFSAQTMQGDGRVAKYILIIRDDEQ